MQMFKPFLPYGGCAEPVPAAHERTPTPGDRGLAIAAYLHRRCAARRSDVELVDLGECRPELALHPAGFLPGLKTVRAMIYRQEGSQRTLPSREHQPRVAAGAN